jgi:uncharacterized RDD family membrane protein YckC
MERLIHSTLARRMGALLIDFLLISVVYTIAINAVPEDFLWTNRIRVKGEMGLSVDLYGLVLVFYFIGCDLLNQGESLGKDILGLRTVGRDGQPPSKGLAVVRTLIKLLSMGVWPLALILFLWKGRAFTLQDYLTRSSVQLRKGDVLMH